MFERLRRAAADRQQRAMDAMRFDVNRQHQQVASLHAQLQCERRVNICLENVRLCQSDLLDTLNALNTLTDAGRRPMLEQRAETAERLLGCLLAELSAARLAKALLSAKSARKSTLLGRDVNNNPVLSDDEAEEDQSLEADGEESYSDEEEADREEHAEQPSEEKEQHSSVEKRPLVVKRRRKTKRRRTRSQTFGRFECPWIGCGFSSSYKQNVDRHQRVHTGERPFKCPVKDCSFAATQAGNLKVHQQRHHRSTGCEEPIASL